jgi:acyl-CoA thioesterase-1
LKATSPANFDFLRNPGAFSRLCFLATCLLIPGLIQAQNSAAPASKGTIVVLGDSLAAGYGLDLEESYPALLQKKIEAAGLNYTVVNAGISGDTSAGGARRVDWLLQRRVEVLVLALGGNDGLRGIPVGVTRTNLQTIIDRTRGKYPQARVVIAGMQMPPNVGVEYRQQFAKLFPDLAKANQCALVPFLLEGVGGKPEFNQPDLIHPTAEGQKMVAENVWKVLKPLLEQPAPP